MSLPLHARVSVAADPSVLLAAADGIEAMAGTVLHADSTVGGWNDSSFSRGDVVVRVDRDRRRITMRRSTRTLGQATSPDLIVSTEVSEGDPALSGCQVRTAAALLTAAAACRDAAPTADLADFGVEPAREATLRAMAVCAAAHLGLDRVLACTPATPWSGARIALDGEPDAVDGFDRLVRHRVAPTVRIETEHDLLRTRVRLVHAPILIGVVLPLEAMRAIRTRRPSKNALRLLRLRGAA